MEWAQYTAFFLIGLILLVGTVALVVVAGGALLRVVGGCFAGCIAVVFVLPFVFGVMLLGAIFGKQIKVQFTEDKKEDSDEEASDFVRGDRRGRSR